jgi:hypothetical protein
MKKHESQFDPAMEWLWEWSVQLNSFLRSGRVGEGVSYLEAQQSERFDAAFRKYLDGTGIVAKKHAPAKPD